MSETHITEPAAPTGGFTGDPAAALTVAGTGGCCGNPPAATLALPEPAAAEAPCCGTAAEATAAGSCCGGTAKADALAAGQSCCG
ncbi:MAG TPA: hypothetical protein VL738_03445 [Dactylosporangium sp.]|jgi:hypothetical protein|nr:hypothetical protein [Dactylosporangium sp.]